MVDSFGSEDECGNRQMPCANYRWTSLGAVRFSEIGLPSGFNCIEHRESKSDWHIESGMGEFSGREPCPARILDDLGGAFSMGVVGGGIWHSIKGFRNAPRGITNRLYYSLDAVKARAPITGGAFAAWGGLFAVFDCSLAAIRRKEDPWNAILSGSLTGGVLAARAGPRAAGKNALIGGVLLAAIEGLGLVLGRMLAPKPPTQEEIRQQGMIDPLEPPTPAGSLGSISDLFASSSSSDSSSSTSSSDFFPSSDMSFSSGFSEPPPVEQAEDSKKKPWYNPF